MEHVTPAPPSDVDPNHAYRYPQAADFLGFSVSKVKQLYYAGKLKGHKVDRSVRIPGWAIIEFNGPGAGDWPKWGAK